MTDPVRTPGAGDIPAQRIDAAHRQAVIVFGAIGLSIVLCVALVQMLLRTLATPAPAPGLATLRIAVLVLAGVVVFFSTVLKGIVLRSAPAEPEARLGRLRSATILSAALAEVPVLLGLVLFLVGRNTGDFYILAVVSLYMLVRHYPRRDPWEEYVRRGGSHAVR